ncbi:hypothetical protein F5X99DRAFT_370277 [Biscogniauxia marginata]|nr:hypothetical protein F5X99DRAFT_370277 [Biscogniauxia marginata]
MACLLREANLTIPIHHQEWMVSVASAMKIERCSAGYSPFLSQSDRTMEVIAKGAEESCG